jgi:hypothetical protein
VTNPYGIPVGGGVLGAPAASGGGGGSGTVTSVNLTAPSTIFSVAGGPVTTAGTLVLSVTGTSGGVPFFSAANKLGTSGALTANALVLGGGAGAAPAPLASLGTATTVLHGNAGGAPTFAAVSLTADVSGTLPVANGGTGLAAGTSGGVPFFSGATTIASSAALTANRIVLGGGAGVAPTVLGSLGTGTTVLHGNAGGAPTFAAVSLTADVSGTLPVANGGTGLTTGVSGGVPYYSSTSAITSSALLTNNALMMGGGAAAAPKTPLALGTSTTVLHGNAGGAPTWGAVSLTADVTGTLPVANGGTGGTALSAVFVGRRGAATIQLVGNGAVLVAGTFWFTLLAPVGFTINSLRAQTGAGSFTANVRIGAVSVTGLAAVAVNTTPTTTNATAANTVVANDVISVIVTSPTGSPTDAVLTLNYTYT